MTKPTKPAISMSQQELAAYIDHSVLKPEFTQDEIRRYLQPGIDVGARTVCVNPSTIDIAVEMTHGTATGVCAVCDFPFGLSTTASKAMQAQMICEARVNELDVVANFGWMRSGQWDRVTEDLRAVADICHAHKVLLKVIFETDTLTKEEMCQATEATIAAGADFIKSSTGFFTGEKREGGSIETMKTMLAAANGRIQVKASGGIRTREHFLSLIDMGVDRIGIGFATTPVVLGL